MDPKLDAIAFLYLTVAHTADGAVSGDEMRTLANGVRAWDPDASLEVIGDVLKRTVERYKQLAGTDERLAEADRFAKTLAGALAPEERARVLTGMRDIAAADGEITEDETSVIDRIGAAFV
jgi:uncharacterized tellurite resistance protein B-like protein